MDLDFESQIIVLSGEPSDRPALVDFANLLTRHISLLMCTNIISDEDLSWEAVGANKTRLNKWLIKNDIKAFYTLVKHQKFYQGAK